VRFVWLQIEKKRLGKNQIPGFSKLGSWRYSSCAWDLRPGFCIFAGVLWWWLGAACEIKCSEGVPPYQHSFLSCIEPDGSRLCPSELVTSTFFLSFYSKSMTMKRQK
jgi:hypothetical protein